jgi:hypothetical protein
MNIPVEILKTIFSFSQTFLFLANRRIINITKLIQKKQPIKRIMYADNVVIYCMCLPIQGTSKTLVFTYKYLPRVSLLAWSDFMDLAAWKEAKIYQFNNHFFIWYISQ